MKLFRFAGTAAVLLSLLFLDVSAQEAEPYKIGPQDVLEVNFWQDEGLNAQVKVSLDGNITLDIIGEIQAAGLTTAELERAIVRQMGRYNKAISQVVVRVIEYNYLKVFITGQVNSPGKYNFEKIPDLWTIINEAGGATDLGDLTRVKIIRGSKDAGKVLEVNVSAMVSSGKAEDLPKIYRDDTIVVPRTFTGLPTEALANNQERRNVFYVIGAVTSPGVQNLENNLDLLEAISLAGGPSVGMAPKMKEISVVSKVQMGTQVTKFNLDEYRLKPYPNRYVVQPEDVIFIPWETDPRRRAFLGLGLTEWVGILGGIGTFLVLADQLSIINISGH
jgi:polysaccharide export outer membrane protein